MFLSYIDLFLNSHIYKMIFFIIYAETCLSTINIAATASHIFKEGLPKYQNCKLVVTTLHFFFFFGQASVRGDCFNFLNLFFN